MKIAVLSGKGGTGKTFVAVNLACVADKAAYIDCDIEEPNGHLFLKPNIIDTQLDTVTVPEVDPNKCTACRECVEFCRYNALALIKDQLLILEELCHSCGGCILFCPQKALSERKRVIGTIEEGISEKIKVLTGYMNIGEESGVSIIKELVKKMPDEGTVVIDCAGGNGCLVMESLRESDFCVLVAEPTIFGVHNLNLVWELVKIFNKPFGVVLNKCLEEENPAEQFCNDHQINILTKIPLEEDLGRINSQGLIAVKEKESYHKLFEKLLSALSTLAKEALF